MKIAWLFPGQGSQSVGMGKALAEVSAAARAVYERADAALDSPISPICFEGPEQELTLTANTQPAILTTSVAALAALREALPDLPPPLVGAGHSLGEYSALVAAGALSLQDAVRIVRLRGRAMQEAVPAGEGGMAAILGGDEDAVRELCEACAEGEVLAPANFNAPGQIVIAGTAAAVKRASDAAARRKLKAISLNVSAPFHCALMEPAARAVEKALSDVEVGDLDFTIVPNVDATPNDDRTKVAELLVRQMDGPVLWEQSVREMAALGVTHALEIGSGRVLAGLARKIDKSIRVMSVAKPEDIEKVRGLFG